MASIERNDFYLKYNLTVNGLINLGGANKGLEKRHAAIDCVLREWDRNDVGPVRQRFDGCFGIGTEDWREHVQAIYHR